MVAGRSLPMATVDLGKDAAISLSADGSIVIIIARLTASRLAPWVVRPAGASGVVQRVCIGGEGPPHFPPGFSP